MVVFHTFSLVLAVNTSNTFFFFLHIWSPTEQILQIFPPDVAKRIFRFKKMLKQVRCVIMDISDVKPNDLLLHVNTNLTL